MDSSSVYEVIRTVTRVFAAIMLIKYTVFLFSAPFHNLKESLRQYRIAKKRGNQEYKPLVSVLIPAWNEEVGIISTISSIMNNSYSNIEIVVVNDGSSDKTEERVKNYARTHKHLYSGKGRSLIYTYQENAGKGKALNNAIDRANGEILVTVDADSIADRDMIKNLVKYFADDNVDAVVGNVKVAGQISFVNLLQRLEYLFGFYHKRAHSVLGAEYIYGGACAAFRHSTVFSQIGKFDDTSITEDIELSLRTRYHGHTAVYANDALCYTEGAGNLFGLVKQRLRWKKGRFEAFRKYRNMFFSTNYRHNRWLTWFVLPFALLAEIQLLFEPIGLTLLIIYSFITGDFSSVILGALFIGIMYVVVGLFTERGKNAWIVPLFPFTWAIFYVLVWVEYMALSKSIVATIRAEGVAWQKWQRKGIGTTSTAKTAEVTE